MTRPEDRKHRAGHQLFARHWIYIQPINYPTVPRGTERLRITPTPAHDVRLIGQLADAMVSVWQELDLALGRDYQPVEQRAQTVAAGSPATPLLDPLQSQFWPPPRSSTPRRGWAPGTDRPKRQI